MKGDNGLVEGNVNKLKFIKHIMLLGIGLFCAGLTSLSWAIGGSIGSYLGPWLVGMDNTLLPWIVFGGLGLLASLLFVLLDRLSMNR